MKIIINFAIIMSEPLAERMRPRTLDDYVGQQHLVGPGAVLRKMIDTGHISSFILWGPPGVGKTTLAQIVASMLQVPFYTLSAVTSGVKDVRDVIERAKSGRFFNSASPILFIDEIHRFSKSQQDSLLGAVERGVVTLIGATTENPSFEIIRPLLSRMSNSPSAISICSRPMRCCAIAVAMRANCSTSSSLSSVPLPTTR